VNTLPADLAATDPELFEFLHAEHSRRDFFRIMYTEPAGAPGFCKDKGREWLREPVRQLTLALKSAIAAKAVRCWPPETLAWTVADLTTGALQRRLASTPATTARQDADFLIDFVYAALDERTF